MDKIGGAHAVLGMDTVAFSKLHDEDQVRAIDCLTHWTTAALRYHSIPEPEYHWSPAGDGGYFTFATPAACRKAIDVAFSLAQRAQRPDWVPRNGAKLELRFGLHAGTVQEAKELGEKTNVWGLGINTAARILAIAAPTQVLVSKQYYDTYVKGQRDQEFEFGDVHWRTVKHDLQLEVMNASCYDLGLRGLDAVARRWQAIGGLWEKTITEYRFLVHDAMKSGEPLAALAAARFLLQLGAHEPVRELCHMLGKTHDRPRASYPSQVHELFSLMPPEALFRVVEQATLRLYKAGEGVCERGDPATTCFFPVSGTILVEVPEVREPFRLGKGDISGEFSLWIPNVSRTARLRAADDVLVLELNRDRFKAILDEEPHLAEVVYGITKRRILEDILKSEMLFPGLANGRSEVLARIAATCPKHTPGSRLDLASAAYVLFNGHVEIEPGGGTPMRLLAKGDFGGGWSGSSRTPGCQTGRKPRFSKKRSQSGCPMAHCGSSRPSLMACVRHGTAYVANAPVKFNDGGCDRCRRAGSCRSVVRPPPGARPGGPRG